MNARLSRTALLLTALATLALSTGAGMRWASFVQWTF
jgi:hypothetical protein